MSAVANTFDRASVRAQQLMLLPGTIGFYFAGRLCVTYLFFQPDPQLGAEVSLALNLLLLAVVAFHSFGPAPALSALRLPTLRWVAVFLGFSLCSLLWSATVSVLVAFAYWSAMAADVAMVVLLLRTGPVDAMSAALMRGYIVGACWIGLVAWLSPTMQDLRPGNDDFFSPNAIGFTCAFGVFFAQYLGRSASGWNPAAIFLAVTLLRSLSKTTILAFAAGEALLLLRDRSIGRRRKLLLATAATLVIAAFWGLFEAYYEVYTNAGNQAETLTGRIGIWTFVLARSFEQPWIGHGFHSFRNVIPPFGRFEAWHAHNELIQQFYAYGVAGVFLVFALYGSFYRQVVRLSSAAHKTLLLGLLLFIAVRGLGDTERFDLSFPLWSIALFSLTLARSQPSVQATGISPSRPARSRP
jgi:exopolysaccharide production protein ExoQ